ncbi:MAG: hypothetical protein LUD47_07690 [Clostridia bacterium]|nr:hypothetical protein [Clostridia bacterium]
MKLINALNDEKKWPEKPVVQDGKGRQYYTNGDIAFRFNNAITDEVGEDNRILHLMDLIEDMLDNYNRGDAVKAGITPQELGYFMDKAKKDEAEQKKKLKPTPYEKEYGIKKEGKFQKNVISFLFGDKEISVDPKYLRNALQIFPDAEFFPMTDATKRVAVLGVRGADGEGFIMPMTGEAKKTDIKDVPRGEEAAPQKPENPNALKPISDGDKKRVAAMEKLARISNEAPKVYDASDGKQVFSNKFMGIRYDKPVIANPAEDKSQVAEKVCNLIDETREACTDELKEFSMQDLTKFMKGIGAVVKEETGKRASKEDYKIVLTDYKNLPHEVNSIYGSNAMSAGNVAMDARLLYNTASQLKNPKIYLSGNPLNPIYIKGDDGDAIVCPVRYNTIKDSRDYKTMKKARYEE